MSIQSHLQQLLQKHNQLKQKLQEERSKTWFNHQIIAKIKQQKLKIKDQISALISPL